MAMRLRWKNYKRKRSLNLDLRLGEGTGAVLAMSLIDAGVKIPNANGNFFRSQSFYTML